MADVNLENAIGAGVANAASGRGLLALLCWLLLCVVLDVGFGSHGFAWGARAGFVAICVMAARSYGLREFALIGFAAAATVLSWRTQGDIGLILSAMDLAAFFGAFIAALTVMREVAARSRSILAVGQYLVLQPAGRRFWAVALGSHLLGVFLNFGAVSLMAPMIQQSAVRADGTKDFDLERRQLSSMIRGFSWVLLWAPTTLSQAVLLAIFTDATWVEFGPLGIASALGFIVIGRLYDRWEWRNHVRVKSDLRLPAPWRETAIISAICAVLIGATLGGSYATGLSIAQILTFLAPVVTLGWFLAQQATAEVPVPGGRMRAIVGVLAPAAPGLARSAVALGLSGYIGSTLGQSLPVSSFGALFDLGAMPGWLFLAALPVLISIGGQVALAPIMLVVLLGELLKGFDSLPTGEPQIIFALSIGWALSMTASPNSTATLLISAACRIPPTTLTWVWNLRYGLLCYGITVGIFAVIA